MSSDDAERATRRACIGHSNIHAGLQAVKNARRASEVSVGLDEEHRLRCRSRHRLTHRSIGQHGNPGRRAVTFGNAATFGRGPRRRTNGGTPGVGNPPDSRPTRDPLSVSRARLSPAASNRAARIDRRAPSRGQRRRALRVRDAPLRGLRRTGGELLEASVREHEQLTRPATARAARDNRGAAAVLDSATANQFIAMVRSVRFARL